MKILLSMTMSYTRKYVGAVRSNRALVEVLAEKGHRVRAVVPLVSPPNPVPYKKVLAELDAQGISVMCKDGVYVFELNGVEVHAVQAFSQLSAYLAEQVREFEPDWTLVSTEDPGLDLLETALKVSPSRVIYIALTPPMLPFGPASLYPAESRAALIGQAAAVSTISHFLADYIRQWSGIEAHVIHPPHFGTGPFPNLGCFDEGYVLMMNACALKGVGIFLALAQALPGIQFAALPGWGTTNTDRVALTALPNVTLLENRERLEDILDQTRVLLMPSLWLEGFGMTVVDTMLRGIPVLASNHSGLVEAKLGTDYLLPVRLIEGFTDQLDTNLLPVPIIPAQDVGPWCEALSSLLSDRELYDRQSEASHAAAWQFVSSLSVDPFEELLVRLAAEVTARRIPSLDVPEGRDTQGVAVTSGSSVDASLDEGIAIAIVGMSCRFPGADGVDVFWRNLREGIESITFFADDETESLAMDRALSDDSNYVRAGGALEGVEFFDASFFGYSPREAAIVDPQQRLFLEGAWEALEDAGYNPEAYEGLIGVYAGAGRNTYLLNNIRLNPDLLRSADEYQIAVGNDRDFLPTRVSYKLNLKGASVSVSTACSTSLVAVCLACQSLLNYQCDMALAGGVTVWVPQRRGYLYREGGILSPDGRCRAFDAQAKGMVFGSGMGIVVLKRLEDALSDGDCIRAVVRGWAVNNDGSLKVGYTAPSVDGQADVIAMAQAMADVDPETITYIEAHGTGTELGDPIEIAALTQVFRASTEKKGFCAIGSVKTNVGHLDAAAGVAGLIKTTLALRHRLIPPSLHFEQPNPKIDFANSPFYVNSVLSEWKAHVPLRAGVSSFGIGGTNAHVVLEEAPVVAVSGESRPWHLLTLSAKTSSALDAATTNLVKHLEQHPELDIADVAYTLQVGRKEFEHRRMLVCRDADGAVVTLEALDPDRVFTTTRETARSVVFMFPGQGAQYVNMGLELYQTEPVFREQVDLCSELFKPHLGIDPRDVLYPSPGQVDEAVQKLGHTWLTQPALFTVEYALARLLMGWGVHPRAMIGHSIGEYVAACLAGVFSLEDALGLVATRGRLMQDLPGGAMVAVPLSEEEIRPLLGEQLSMAALNEPSRCVVSGPLDSVEELERQLAEMEINCRRLHTSHAFHSAMMDPILEAFTKQVNAVDLKPPRIPYVSNVTGTWITSAEATAPIYWAEHLRQTVRFSDGIRELLRNTDWILLQVGPGRTLSTLAKRHPGGASEHVVLSSLRHPRDAHSDTAFLLTALGKLWLTGVQVDWAGFYANEQRRRMPLPTYPFERKRFWIEPLNTKDRGALSKEGAPADMQGAAKLKQSLAGLSHERETLVTEEGTISQGDALEQIVMQQLEVISQQLDVLREDM